MLRKRRLPRIALLARLRRLAVVLGAIIAMTTAGTAGTGWDGTWHGGFDSHGNGDGDGGGDGVQLIITGGEVLGFYYNGEYLDTDTGTAAADGSITFHWAGGEGTLADTAGKRQLAIHEKGKSDRVIPLERDK